MATKHNAKKLLFAGALGIAGVALLAYGLRMVHGNRVRAYYQSVRPVNVQTAMYDPEAVTSTGGSLGSIGGQSVVATPNWPGQFVPQPGFAVPTAGGIDYRQPWAGGGQQWGGIIPGIISSGSGDSWTSGSPWGPGWNSPWGWGGWGGGWGGPWGWGGGWGGWPGGWGGGGGWGGNNITPGVYGYNPLTGQQSYTQAWGLGGLGGWGMPGGSNDPLTNAAIKASGTGALMPSNLQPFSYMGFYAPRGFAHGGGGGGHFGGTGRGFKGRGFRFGRGHFGGHRGWGRGRWGGRWGHGWPWWGGRGWPWFWGGLELPFLGLGGVAGPDPLALEELALLEGGGGGPPPVGPFLPPIGMGDTTPGVGGNAITPSAVDSSAMPPTPPTAPPPQMPMAPMDDDMDDDGGEGGPPSATAAFAEATAAATPAAGEHHDWSGAGEGGHSGWGGGHGGWGHHGGWGWPGWGWGGPGWGWIGRHSWSPWGYGYGMGMQYPLLELEEMELAQMPPMMYI